MIYLHYKDTKTFGHSFSFPLIFKTLRTSYLQVGNFSKVISKWKKSNPNLFKKYRKIYDELLEHPKTGLGHPEALKGGKNVTWSRHISAYDRIIYDIFDDVVEVYVLEIEGHYNDK